MFTKCENIPNARKKIPYTGGIELRILYGAFASASSRAIVECPFEYAKVKRQTG